MQFFNDGYELSHQLCLSDFFHFLQLLLTQVFKQRFGVADVLSPEDDSFFVACDKLHTLKQFYSFMLCSQKHCNFFLDAFLFSFAESLQSIFTFPILLLLTVVFNLVLSECFGPSEQPVFGDIRFSV
jgi:hypothetical protein